MAAPRTPSIQFAADVVCPWAYIASKRIEALAASTGAELEWHPTLLGGIYRQIRAPQGKDGSASDLNAPQKQRYESRELYRTAKRWGVDLKFHPKHPVRSVRALRLLHSVVSQKERAALFHALFRAYWIDNLDVASQEVLLGAYNATFPWKALKPEELHYIVDVSDTYKGALRTTTDYFVRLGAVGVPDCFVPDTRFDGAGRMFWGGDRFHFVAGAVEEARQPGDKVPVPISAVQETVMPRKPIEGRQHMTFWFDFSSPWTYLGWTQVKRIMEEAGPGLTVSLKPTLLGIVFKSIGTPVVPSAVTSPAKRKLQGIDLQNWVRYWSHLPYPDGRTETVPFRFNSHFPVRTPQALRIALSAIRAAGSDQARPGDAVWELVDLLFKAVWADDVDVSDVGKLAGHLDAKGLDGKALVDRANEGGVCEGMLRENTAEFIRIGGCGFPTFQVGSEIAWGQDRIDLVHDLLRGWTPDADTRATVVLRARPEPPKM
ncbi:thioredoxin-like protein [Hyaloraphidium curvatum]|nr:thioredoxin-like protein [Hyaloraphidium curvatum]